MTEPMNGVPLKLYINGKPIERVANLGRPVAADVLTRMRTRCRMTDYPTVGVQEEIPANAPPNMQRILNAAREMGASEMEIGK